jgi:hypothetical protein
MKKTLLWRKISLFLFTVSILLIFLEVASRFHEKKYAFNTDVALQTAKLELHRRSGIPGLSYELIPDAKTKDGFFQINSHGIRDKEYQIPKPHDVYRIIVLGDSVTFGTEYSVDQTYPKILEQKLNSQKKNSKKYEVLNAGVCAYNALQKYILFKNKLFVYQPDMVIYQFLNDDYYKNYVIWPEEKSAGFKKTISMGDYFKLNFPRILPLNKKIDVFLKEHSAIYRVLNKNLYDYLSIRNPEKYFPQAYRYAGFNNIEESITQNKKVFEKFMRLSKSLDFEFLVLLVPELTNNDNLDPWIKNDAPEKLGFNTVNLFDQFKFLGIDLADLRVIPSGICHFNQKGHQLAAQVLFESIDWGKDQSSLEGPAKF